MATHTSEQDLRREAIRRRLAGEHRSKICLDLDRSTSWFGKWWAEYRRDPSSDLGNRSRAPHTSPQSMPDEVVQATVAICKTLEAAVPPKPSID